MLLQKVCAIFVSLILGMPLALAQEEEPLGPTDAPSVIPLEERPFRLGLSYRLWATGLSPFPIDPNGDTLEESVFAEHRLRVRPVFRVGERLSLLASADLLTGLLLGETTDKIPAADFSREERNGLETARVREFFMEYRFLGTPKQPGGAVRLGLQTSHFGLGLLTNDGQSTENDWGLQRFGDESLRALVASRPLAIFTQGKKGLPWQLVLAADVVRSDSLANLADGDIAFQGVAALQYIQKEIEGGIYVALRDQTAPIDIGDLDAETLNALAYDLFFSIDKPIGNSTFSLAFEAALITGSTTLTRSETNPDGAEILQGGGVFRSGIRRGIFEAEFELGFASGDANPNDANITNFSFSRDYNVSLLLFEEVLASLTGRDGSRAADPNLGQIAQDGVEFIPSNGSVTGAGYGKITGRLYPAEHTRFVFALLAAQASADLIAPFSTFENGGAFANHLGGDSQERFLGVESNIGALHRVYIGKTPLDFSLQGGLFLPGDALQNREGERMPNVYTVQAGFSIPTNITP